MRPVPDSIERRVAAASEAMHALAWVARVLTIQSRRAHVMAALRRRERRHRTGDLGGLVVSLDFAAEIEAIQRDAERWAAANTTGPVRVGDQWALSHYHGVAVLLATALAAARRGAGCLERAMVDVDLPELAGRLRAGVECEAAQLRRIESARRPRKAVRQGSLDLRACALVDAWRDPDSPDYRPGGFRHADVAAELGSTRQALTGRQRDGTPRCPEYLRQYGALDSRRAGPRAKRPARPRRHD